MLGDSTLDICLGTMVLSPIIEPVKMVRDRETHEITERVEFEFERLDIKNVDTNPRAEPIEDGWVLYWSNAAEIYFHDGQAHVKQRRFDVTPLVVLQEAVADAVSDMAADGVVVGLQRVEL